MNQPSKYATYEQQNPKHPTRFSLTFPNRESICLLAATCPSSLLPLTIPNFKPAHFDGTASRRRWRRRSVSIGQWGSNRSIPPTLLLASSGLPKFMAENFNGRSCRRRMQPLRSEKGGWNRGLGFRFFWPMGFLRFGFFHIFTFYFLVSCYFRLFFSTRCKTVTHCPVMLTKVHRRFNLSLRIQIG